MSLLYECLEPGCGWKTTSATEEELLKEVSEHMASVHDTFELEDVIIDNAVTTT